MQYVDALDIKSELKSARSCPGHDLGIVISTLIVKLVISLKYLVLD
ncbi:protein of unknown function [Candidatus Nitrosocosmicus franklandus]|uniref:Uncharacterized protein n=1 Tax=Candidatus Nitrosocosmicus franklandianus TaxID=1798806 RepID=A0A484IEB2_9ARCH|nr:protein of unknown function [Candidatus Nitrosocosmicus franklandus]